MKQRANVLGLLAGLLGTAALWLPCVAGETPFYYGGSDFFPNDWEISTMAWGVFLAVPILIWQIFRFVGKVPFKGELAIIYILSATTMLPPLLLNISMAKYTLRGEGTVVSFLLLAAVPLIAANIALLWHNLKTKGAAEITCGNFLLGAYVPNALTAIFFASSVSFFGSSKPFESWDVLGIGAYLVLAACALCIGSIISSMSTR